MKTANYRMKQSELYTIARFALAAVNFLITRFSAFKGKYNAAWVAARLVDVDNAEDLPDEEQRNEDHQTKHIELDKMVQKSLDKFNALERYIAEVFAEDVLQVKIDAAGGTYYAAASNGDFDATDQLLTRGFKFIDDNETQLLNGGNNMPATFKGEFETLKNTFKSAHTDFLGSEAGAQLGTEEKIDNNNNIYSLITSINADAQAIFIAPGEESEAQQFVLEHQLFLVRGAGVAGMRFHLTDKDTDEDLQDVSITIKTGVTVTTDATGRAIKLQLAADKYSVKFTKPLYTVLELELIIQTGTVKRVNVQLQKA